MRHICIWQQIRRHFIYGFSDQCGIFDHHQQNIISSPSSRRHSYRDRYNSTPTIKKEEYDEDDVSVCCVCFDGTFTDKNPIIFCDRCNLGVHRYCYGIRKIPNENEEWLCESCQFQKSDLSHIMPQCCLCPVIGGLLISLYRQYLSLETSHFHHFELVINS